MSHSPFPTLNRRPAGKSQRRARVAVVQVMAHTFQLLARHGFKLRGLRLIERRLRRSPKRMLERSDALLVAAERLYDGGRVSRRRELDQLLLLKL